MTPIDIAEPQPPSARRVVLLGVIRALASTTALVELYFI